MAMNKQMKVFAGIAGAVAAIGLITVIASAGNEDHTRKTYDKIKQDLGLTDLMSEGDVSFGFFSGTLTVENPEFRGIPNQQSAQRFARSYAEVFASSYQPKLAMQDVIGMQMVLSAQPGDGVIMKADRLAISSDGDAKSGHIKVGVEGLDLSKPYVATVASQVVSADEIADELTPKEGLGENDFRVNGTSYNWHPNVSNKLSGVGNWIINGVGAFGAKADLSIEIERSSSGSGSIWVNVKHHLNGDALGEIKRELKFSALPELDEVVAGLLGSANGFVAIVHGAGATGGQNAVAILEDFARKARMESYDIHYTGYADLKSAYADSQLADMNAFCTQRQIQRNGLLNTSKFAIDDSECAIATSLIEDGEYTEKYTFSDDKTLFSELMVNKKFEVSIN